MKLKKGEVLNQVLVHVILVGLIFALFFMATAGKVNARGVKQQVLEKEIALLIDASEPGMNFEIEEFGLNGVVQNIELRAGRVFVSVEGLGPINGYPYFTKHKVDVSQLNGKFVVSVR